LSSVVPSNHRRTFSSKAKASSSLLARTQPAAHPTIVVFSPSPQHLQEEEVDVDLIPHQDIKIELTDRAAEVRCVLCMFDD
jgi:hypothetical protein